jgi:glycosyltransferase involved in cell wall biosynthesis
VPVVQPRHGAFPELLARGGGLLCAPHDADALAAGLEELLVDREAAARLAADGRRAVAEYFTSARMASEFEAVCKMAAS